MTTFVLRDHSKNPHSPEELIAAAEILDSVLMRDVASAWGCMRHYVRTSPKGIEPNEIELAIFDDEKAASMLGYHATDPRGMPYGHVRRSDVEHPNKGPNSLTVLAGRRALVHALLPFDVWLDRAESGGGVEELLSIGDRVAGTTYAASKEIHVADLPNFLLPAAIRPNGEAPFDKAGLLDASMRAPGGYAVVRSVACNANKRDGAIHMLIGMMAALDGQNVPPDELRRLGHPSSHARRHGMADPSATQPNGGGRTAQRPASP